MLGKLVGNSLESRFIEPHTADLYLAVLCYQKNCGNVGESVRIGRGVTVRVQERGEGDSMLTIEFFCAAWIVLGNPDDGNTLARKTLEDALKKGERELTDGA